MQCKVSEKGGGLSIIQVIHLRASTWTGRWSGVVNLKCKKVGLVRRKGVQAYGEVLVDKFG